MQQHGHRRREAGFTFAELAFGLLILVIGAVVLANHLAVNYRTTATERDRVFAFTKAQAILAEIQGFVDRGAVDAAVDLDVLDDGITNRPALTIQTDALNNLVLPDHVVSGNYQRDNQWVWSRRISVQPFAGINNRNVRYVTVRILRKDGNGEDKPIADLSAVINSAGTAFPTTQVFDLYLLAIENIPGWWVFMDSIRPFVESMVTDLETRNPGLVFRSHWITKAAFGRNQAYRPYTNDTTDSHQPIEWVYHYPGRMPTGNASSYYYVPDNMAARILCDGVERNGYDGQRNPHPYALADFFNHAMRYPDELRLWQRRVQAVNDREQQIRDATVAGVPPPAPLWDMSKEPTYRILLEEMYSNPNKYRNSLVINLHGELLPMPALRNYSDAAKSPGTQRGLRVVTHPETLWTSAANDARLRVYAYADNREEYESRMALSPSDPNWASDITVQPIVLEFPDMNLTDALDSSLLRSGCELENIPGGVPVGGSSIYAANWQTARHKDDPLRQPREMYYQTEYDIPTNTTRLFLFNTPVVAPVVTPPSPDPARGVPSGNRGQLYGMTYVPTPTPLVATADPAVQFAQDLTTPAGAAEVRNTARWRMRITTAVRPASGLLTVLTRIASDLGASPETWRTSGTLWPNNDPDNLSTTYTWWSSNQEDVPLTERYQFNGDPRHVPYADSFMMGASLTSNTNYSYNWYHDSLNNSGDARADFGVAFGVDNAERGARLRNRWTSGMACDVPRYFEVLRKALVRSACIYTTLTGWSYYYLGIGNDIGYDSANGYPNSIPSNLEPHGFSFNWFLNTITGARRLVRQGGANYWWGIPWLGELYPDVAYAAVLNPMLGVPGNLPSGTTAARFYQDAANSVYAGSTGYRSRQTFGTSMQNHHQRTQDYGCTTFFNIGTSASTFQHMGSGGNGALTAVGSELATNYKMNMPAAAPITRPFRVAMGTGVADHWNLAPYSTNRYTGSLYRTYYDHAPSGAIGSGLVKLADNTNTSAAYIVVNGISNAVDNGTTFISKFAMLSLVHSFFEAGNTGNTLRVLQLPRIEIQQPTDITELLDPTNITVQWGTTWRRWDGLPYATTGVFAEDELDLRYVLMYSPDNGDSYYHVQDHTPATPGTPPSVSYQRADAGAGPETYSWSVPLARFPEGSYVLRIDCYRNGAQVHYAYHQTKIYIQR